MNFINWTDIKNNFKKDRIMFAIRIITGVLISIFAADLLHIDFAPSTGVITLLTVDETKRDTFRKIVLRIISFLYTYLFAWLTIEVFKLDYTSGFAIAIAAVTFLTFLLRWDITLSVNCVILIQLFLDNKAFNMNLFLNETGRLVIGLLSAVLVNEIFRARYDSEELEKKLETKDDQINSKTQKK